MLSKKHFKAIAEILNKNRFGKFEDLTDDFTEYFKFENPNFDEEKFKQAVLK